MSKKAGKTKKFLALNHKREDVPSDPNYFFIHHHLGLGDFIVCNAIVRFLYNKLVNYNLYTSIKLAVPNKILGSISQLYQDIYIDLHVVHGYGDTKCPPMYRKGHHIKIGFHHCRFPHWEKSFYDQMGLDYSYRYSNFHISRNLDREKILEDKLKLPKKFALCNTDCSTGSYNVPIQTRLPKIYISNMTDSLFDWIGVLHKASEIHTIDTAIFHLIKQLSWPPDLKAKKYFYNTYRINSSRTPFSLDGQDWKIINV